MTDVHRHVLITGAAGGIGSALARRWAPRLAEAGGRLSLVDRDREGLAAVARSLPCDVADQVADLTDVDAIPDWLAALEEQGGPIDAVVNMAGVMDVRSVAAIPWEAAHRQTTINLVAPLRIMHGVVGGMVARGAGTIVNVSSYVGLTPVRGNAFYGGAKAGLALASEVLRAEVRDRGVHVVTVFPGSIATPLERGARAQMQRSFLGDRFPPASPDKLAARILDAVDRRRPRVVYPRMYGLPAWLPRVSAAMTTRLVPPPLE